MHLSPLLHILLIDILVLSLRAGGRELPDERGAPELQKPASTACEERAATGSICLEGDLMSSKGRLRSGLPLQN